MNLPIEAILFDLDGTLLDNDMDHFLQCYLRDLSAYLARLLPPSEFVQNLLDATNRVVTQIDPDTTNAEAFERAFDQISPIPLEELRPVLDDFYAGQFGKLAGCTRRLPEARDVVQLALDQGRKAVIATNPVFPLTAVQQRMEWAGIADLPFALVTSYENMHFTKPHVEYYQEIADRLQVPPERCLMVGDDLKLDAPAVQAGMRFFWITNDAPFDETRGTLAHLHSLVRDGCLGV